jgi:hypothetical protein
MPGGASVMDTRLRRCIRDLAALEALPSMCVGRSVDEVVELSLEALPAVLTSDVLYLSADGIERAVAGRGAPLDAGAAAALGKIAAAVTADGGGPAWVDAPGRGRACVMAASFPAHAGVGRLLVGRATALDEETDVVLDARGCAHARGGAAQRRVPGHAGPRAAQPARPHHDGGGAPRP